MSFKPTHLYIKKHILTGLMYFGMTTKDVSKYLGSGKYWKGHITKHKKEFVETFWSETFTNKDDCIEFCEFFSGFFDIVNSKSWANMIPESGTTAFAGSRNTSIAKLKIDGSVIGHISCNDPRWKTGEIAGISHGLEFSEEHKRKLSIAKTGKTISRTPEHNAKIGLSQKNTACAYDPSTKQFIGRLLSSDPRWKTGEIVGSRKKTNVT